MSRSANCWLVGQPCPMYFSTAVKCRSGSDSHVMRSVLVNSGKVPFIVPLKRLSGFCPRTYARFLRPDPGNFASKRSSYLALFLLSHSVKNPSALPSESFRRIMRSLETVCSEMKPTNSDKESCLSARPWQSSS